MQSEFRHRSQVVGRNFISIIMKKTEEINCNKQKGKKKKKNHNVNFLFRADNSHSPLRNMVPVSYSPSYGWFILRFWGIMIWFFSGRCTAPTSVWRNSRRLSVLSHYATYLCGFMGLKSQVHGS